MFLIIQTINSTFQSRDEGEEYASVADARNAAMLASSEIAFAELKGGKEAISVESVLLRRDGSEAGRLVVSASVSDLMSPPLKSSEQAP